MSGFDPACRVRNLARLADETFDLLVIGGGITGAGVAREAALRGLSVALVEARDFASGTSSRSSKLIHGGLRYLEQGEIALVREAATERKSLRRIAPHRTAVASMLLPVHGRTSAGLYKLRVGLALYEKLAAVAASERHEVLGRDDTLAAEPHLAGERLQGAIRYPEYQTDDARLVLDTLKSAHHAGAVVGNYLRVTQLGAAGAPRVVDLRDEESGVTFAVRAHAVVNAAGPWVDDVRRLDRPEDAPSLHLTKGIHVVFRPSDLPARHCVVMRARDGRPVFVVPRRDHVYVGTTDTDYVGPLDEPQATVDDVAYLQEALERTFQGIAASRDRAIGAWAGLRPLVQEPGKKPSEISRKDEIVVSTTGVVTIAGGKLTAYRRMAERVVETVAPLIGRSLAASRSAEETLPGGDLHGALDLESFAALPLVRAALGALPAETGARLIATYGGDALDLVATADGPDTWSPVATGVPLCAAEVRYSVRHEMALTLVDILERRTRLSYFATDTARGAAPAVAAIAARELGWNADRVHREVAAFTRQCDARLAWRNIAV
ncbi:MAG: glycerol-3-phosphate dehydrogenase/oxidase [Deltaproteobacteria bacterium]|nr:glycerol-3-phosphate dehydrogenase/oxidase [Deltaproteobacteria bacterium]